MLDTNTRVEKIWKHSYGPTTRPEIDPLPIKHLAQMVRETSKTYTDRTAFSVCLPNGMSADLSYAEVDLFSDYFALYLREKLGLVANDRVAVQMPNCLAYGIA
ncbi:MAG: AMP-binding protein, partial [Spirochaetia bacterium]|nr:AMP-binding protein [Spirochaetia bacterium]